ncbi:MAG: L,D-transpeptidase [Cyanobacteria bacterium K_DeepCast_35m_m2_023]|nr:L,D-transpeptidase [Cyanobacteria bacterium K_DeepCast_35m_m2_023]
MSNGAHRTVLLSGLLALGGGNLTPAPAHADPAQLGDQPPAAVELVLDRRRRQLRVLANGSEQRRYPVAIGRPGWETPVGRFRVLELVKEPAWVHPVSGVTVAPGLANPLGSRWIGFHEDCTPRRGFNGQPQRVLRQCATAGFHGTPLRGSIGHAVSHGCVRLLDEHIRDVFELVDLGTPVTVLP